MGSSLSSLVLKYGLYLTGVYNPESSSNKSVTTGVLRPADHNNLSLGDGTVDLTRLERVAERRGGSSPP